MENNRIGTSYMYPNETINPKHHVSKSTNNNQLIFYGVNGQLDHLRSYYTFLYIYAFYIINYAFILYTYFLGKFSHRIKYPFGKIFTQT